MFPTLFNLNFYRLTMAEKGKVMSKGNNKKGNREARKPKKISKNTLATANFLSKLSEVKLGSKKQK